MKWPNWNAWPVPFSAGGSGAPAQSIFGSVAVTLPGLVALGGGNSGTAIAGSGAVALAGLAASASGSSGSAPSIGTPLDTASIFYSGHSLLDAAIAANVEAIATDRGYFNEYQNQMYPGSTIWARNAGSVDPYVNPDVNDWDGWQNGQDKNGGAQNALTEIRTHASIGQPHYTHLIITEEHNSLEQLRYSYGLQALRAYYETFIANTNGQIFYYDSWRWIHDPNDLTEWIACTRAQTVFNEGVTSRINDSLNFAGFNDRLTTLPAGSALAELLEQATTGTVAGITQGSTSATLFTVIQDEAYTEGDVHLTAVGAYFIGCVVYASVYRRSPVGAATVSGVTGTQATSLQNIAWTFVQAYYNGQINGPQHNTAARLSQASTFATTYCNYDSAPGSIAGFQAYFTATNAGNPIYWSSGADAPAGGWWPFPI